jgi:RNA polymerase sigma-70 factor (ECF subfamily)
VDETRSLVSRAKNKDVCAFEKLVRIYQNKVYGLCFKLSGNHEDAQDLAQETFVKAYGSLKGFRNEADFGTWLHRIAVNTWLNLCRKNSSHHTLSLDEPYQWNDSGELQREVAAAEDCDPLLSLEAKEFQALVRTALSSLTEEHRTVIVLRDIEGYSYEEVSRMLGCSLGTVKSRINRAREVMRRKLRELTRETGEVLPAGKERR